MQKLFNIQVIIINIEYIFIKNKNKTEFNSFCFKYFWVRNSDL